MEEDIFKNENEVLEKAKDVIEKKELSTENLWNEYGDLKDKYQNLLKLSMKLTKVGDRYQKKAIDAEQKLRELNATKDIFFSIIAHDLKNPLTIIMGFADLLANSWDMIDEENRKNQVIQINDATVSLFKLLNNLLDWARLQTGAIEFKRENFNLRTVIDETIALLDPGAQSKGITISTELTEDMEIPMDQEMIRTVIRNLISNAVKFTSSGGSITVSASRNEENAEIAVADTGKGMKEEDLAKLFRIDQHFSTRGTANEKGTGLGLILCKEFIDKHKGTIRAESEPGQGTRFIIDLPLF